MIATFNARNIAMLEEMGYEVHAACNFNDRSAWTDEQAYAIKKQLVELGAILHQIDFPRKPYHPVLLTKSYRQISELIKEIPFELIHDQSCVSGILGRFCCRKSKIKFIHTCHGLYYFKGGPIYNWIFYPFEKLCSRWTDVLITINGNDYEFTKKHMSAKKTVYMPGVGIDTDYYKNTVIDKAKMRRELGIPENAFVVLSVGELNSNKNHEIILRAIKSMNMEDVYYVINGDGVLREHLKKLAESLGLSDRFILTGNVKNVNEYYKMADVFAFPSKREGLGLSALEAMAAGLPIITSNKNGINDYSKDGVTGFVHEPDDEEGYKEALVELYNSPELRKNMGTTNEERVLHFSKKSTDDVMREVYGDILNSV